MSSLARVHCDLFNTVQTGNSTSMLEYTQSVLYAYLEGKDADLQLSNMCKQN